MRKIHRLWKFVRPIYHGIMNYFGPSVYDGGLPRGVFIETENILNDSVMGAITLDGQKIDFSLFDSEINAAGLDQGKYANWRAIWSMRENCFLAAPSLAHINSNARVCNEAIYGIHGWKDPVWRRKKPSSVKHLSGDYTSIVSQWNMGHNYYHWFMDGLTRLLHLNSFPENCRIIVPEFMPEYARRSFELLGIDDRFEPATGHDLLIERYWFAGPTMLSGCPNPAGVAWLRSKLISSRERYPNKLIYVDRVAATRNCINGDELRHFFYKKGWDVVDPGALTLDQQIEIFSSARVVIGVHGAAMTNILWAPKNSHVLELIPSKRRNGCYAGIAMAAELNHKALVFESDRYGRMHVPIDILERSVKKLESKL